MSHRFVHLDRLLYWSISVPELLNLLDTTPEGLSVDEASRRHGHYVSVRLKPHRDIRPTLFLIAQFRSPIILILLFAAIVSLFLADRTDALIILTIILVSALLGFWQEYGAAKAVGALLALVHVTAKVWRGGWLIEVPGVNLSHGAKRMAREKVIVKRLAAIENFGGMNILCSDKTGTLTEGVMRLHAAIDSTGKPSEIVRLHAYLNAAYETGFINPLDDAIRSQCTYDLSTYKKLDEMPYDFVRKRLSILVATSHTHVLITKGAVEQVLTVCSHMEDSQHNSIPLEARLEAIRELYQNFNRQGFRTLGLACRDMGTTLQIGRDHETDMTFLGLLVFSDPVKADMAETVASLRRLGVMLKIITGDHRLVAAHVGEQAGINRRGLLTGQDLRQMTNEALVKQVGDIDIFAEVEPNQKDRIILALKRSGNVVGHQGPFHQSCSARDTPSKSMSSVSDILKGIPLLCGSERYGLINRYE